MILLKRKASILVIDDDTDILFSAQALLEDHFTEIITLSNPDETIQLLKKKKVDLVLVDMNFSPGKTDGKEGLALADKILEEFPAMVVVFMTAFGEIQLAIDAMKKNVFDFVLKPWDNKRLIATILAGVNHAGTVAENRHLREVNRLSEQTVNLEFSEIVGHSPAMVKIRELIDRIANTGANVLILGESGTGKELIARELHRKSERAGQNFIPVDLGSVAETLFESELFGHVKGAFTGACSDRTGKFELASGGTIFLDEIGNLPLKMQLKLLSVLQDRRVCPLGADFEIQLDFRLISATNANLEAMVAGKLFRQDFYYRVNTFEIKIPPLRQRTEDILPISMHFLKKFGQKYKKTLLQIDKKGERKLKNHTWPGNIRELKNVIERAVILSDGKKLPVDEALAFVPITKNALPENLKLDDLEKNAILISLQKNKGIVSKAARDLGIQRNALYRRMEKYGL